MKPFGLALAAIFAAATFAASPTAFAADKAAPYTKDQITQGQKDAPAVVQGAGLTCTVADAALMGEGTGKNPDDPKGKDLKVKNYEVACQQGMGYVIQNYEGLTPKIYDCVSLADSQTTCRLPENTDPKKLLAGLVTASGRTCTINNVRGIGASKTGERFYEVGCAEGLGFLIKAPAPTSHDAPVAEDCAQVMGSKLECKFTTQTQVDAAANNAAAALLAKSGKTCQLSKSRLIGTLQSGDTGYEVACQDGSGYVLTSLASGEFHQAINCANAGEACKLTDATKAESAENGTYTRLAKAAGYQCDVGKYRYIGMDQQSNSEVVELQCSNRPDGAIALFPTNNSPGKILDCVQAGGLGQSCKLTDPAVVYPKYTQALAAKGKRTCTVSGAHWLASVAGGDSYIETACSDGLPGWVLLMTAQGSVSEVHTCGELKASGVSCSLPGNTK